MYCTKRQEVFVAFLSIASHQKKSSSVCLQQYMISVIPLSTNLIYSLSSKIVLSESEHQTFVNFYRRTRSQCEYLYQNQGYR